MLGLGLGLSLTTAQLSGESGETIPENAVTHEGEPVTNGGEIVTYTQE